MMRWGRRGGIEEQEKRNNNDRNEWMMGWGQLTVSGYDHKLLLLADRIMHKLVNFKVNPDRFDFIKVRTYVRAAGSSPRARL